MTLGTKSKIQKVSSEVRSITTAILQKSKSYQPDSRFLHEDILKSDVVSQISTKLESQILHLQQKNKKLEESLLETQKQKLEFKIKSENLQVQVEKLNEEKKSISDRLKEELMQRHDQIEASRARKKDRAKLKEKEKEFEELKKKHEALHAKYENLEKSSSNKKKTPSTLRTPTSASHGTSSQKSSSSDTNNIFWVRFGSEGKKRKRKDDADSKQRKRPKKNHTHEEAFVTETPIEFITKSLGMEDVLDIPDGKGILYLKNFNFGLRGKRFIQKIALFKKLTSTNKEWTCLYYVWNSISMEALHLNVTLELQERRTTSDLLLSLANQSLAIRRSGLQKCCLVALSRLCMSPSLSSFKHFLINRLNYLFGFFQTSQTQPVRICCEAFFEIIIGFCDCFSTVEKLVRGTIANKSKSVSELQRIALVKITGFYFNENITIEFKNLKGETLKKTTSTEKFYKKHKMEINKLVLTTIKWGISDKSSRVRKQVVKLYETVKDQNSKLADKIRKGVPSSYANKLK